MNKIGIINMIGLILHGPPLCPCSAYAVIPIKTVKTGNTGWMNLKIVFIPSAYGEWRLSKDSCSRRVCWKITSDFHPQTKQK
jgi:hypothetical protein